MSATETTWGTVERDDEGDLFLGDVPVLEVGEEGFHLVLVAAGGYEARWVDENGTAHAKVYKTQGPALKKARESWGC
jgi:hypothetical protein